MRQFQYEVDDAKELSVELKKLSVWLKGKLSSEMLFTIFTTDYLEESIDDICKAIKDEFPYAHYAGCSSDGNIVDGDLSRKKFAVSCTIFEYPNTKIRVLQYQLDQDNYLEATGNLLWQVERYKWATAVEMITTIRGMSMTGVCNELSKARPDVMLFGGGAFNVNMNENHACVFSEDAGYSEKGAVFILYGGDDFHLKTMYVSGWKPLGRDHLVTNASGCVLYELDGKPAYDTYFKYLKIGNDEDFFYNTLEFPFFYNHNGIDILRAPTVSQPDGSLIMTSDIDENVTAKIAYGDPWTILESVKKSGHEIMEFCPESIAVFSCAARRTFWGDDEVGKETIPFQSIAPTYGFYTSSEFLRTNGSVNQHNVTLVIAAMREGEPDEKTSALFEMDEEKFSGKVSMINRLATFIKATTDELEQANQKLKEMAITDGLTGVYNRREIQQRITEAMKQYSSVGENMKNNKLSLVMLDIDDFKKVNDMYGHKEGDDVLIGLCDMLKDAVSRCTPGASIGRWGGEEFMILMPGYSIEHAKEAAETIRVEFSNISFEKSGCHTISLGVAELDEGESVDAFCMRVDSALYKAKGNGKDQVVAG